MKTLGVLGCGLIGGSFALAAKKYDCFERVVGRDLDADTLHTAIDQGVVDAEWQNGSPVNAICVAVPTRNIAESVRCLQVEVTKSVPIFDVGSVKATVLNSLNHEFANFVPCHPIAGSHNSGPAAAEADLFQGKTCVISPTQATNQVTVDAVAHWWRQVGATVMFLDADQHDALLATTSHLPHLLSCAAVELVSKTGESAFDLVGSGFKDFSRIAAGNEEIWRSIVVDNLANLRLSFRAFSDVIEHMLELAEQDPQRLENLLRDIAQHRKSMNG